MIYKFVSIFHQGRQLVELQKCGRAQISQLMRNAGPSHMSTDLGFKSFL